MASTSRYSDHQIYFLCLLRLPYEDNARGIWYGCILSAYVDLMFDAHKVEIDLWEARATLLIF